MKHGLRATTSLNSTPSEKLALNPRWRSRSYSDGGHARIFDETAGTCAIGAQGSFSAFDQRNAVDRLGKTAAMDTWTPKGNNKRWRMRISGNWPDAKAIQRIRQATWTQS